MRTLLSSGWLALALSSVGTAHAGEDVNPRIWTWREPPYVLSHVDDGVLVPLLRVPAGADCLVNTDCCEIDCGCVLRSPEQVVNRLVAEYAAHPAFFQGEAGICLQLLGMGDGDPCPNLPGLSALSLAPALFTNWCDGLAGADSPECDGCSEPTVASGDWLTPWMDQGICESGEWMDRFVIAYQAAQTSGALPAPRRFHFDTENWPMAAYWDSRGVEAFLRMGGWFGENQSPDGRWTTDIIPGTGATMSELWETANTAGVPLPVPGSWSTPANEPWTSWYDGLILTACDGAMNGAFYERIRNAWPEALASNFCTSLRADGQDSGPGTPARVFKNRRHQSASWYQLVARGSADLQAPEFYPVSSQHAQPGETTGQVMVRIHRQNVETCLASYGGFPAERLTPWVPQIGTAFRVNIDNNDQYIVTKADVRDLFAMLRLKGVREMLSWTGSGPSDPMWGPNWNSTNDLVDQVWGADVASFQVEVGSPYGGARAEENVDLIRRSDAGWGVTDRDRQLAVDAVPAVDSTGYSTQVTIAFESDFGLLSTQRLQFVVESRLASDEEAVLSLFLWHWDEARWHEVDLTSPATGAYVNRFDRDSLAWTHEELAATGASLVTLDRNVLTLTVDDAAPFFDPNERVRMRLRYDGPAPFTALLDAVQMIESDESIVPLGACPGDVAPAGGDGAVDIQDLLAAIAQFGEGGGLRSGQKRTGRNTLEQVLDNWGPCH